VGAETLVEEDARALDPEPLQGEIEDPGPRSAYWALKNGTLVRLHKGPLLYAISPTQTPPSKIRISVMILAHYNVVATIDHRRQVLNNTWSMGG
jgi:hypothetical protein